MLCDSEGRLRKRREASRYALYFLPTLFQGSVVCRSREAARDRRAGSVGRARIVDHIIVRAGLASVRLRHLTKLGAPHVGDADRGHGVIGDAVGRRERDALYRTDRMPVLLGASEQGGVVKLA